MKELDERLKKAVQARDILSAEAQKLEGMKQAAEVALKSIREEIEAEGLDPDTLGEYLRELENTYSQSVSDFEEEVRQAKLKLQPYMEKIS